MEHEEQISKSVFDSQTLDTMKTFILEDNNPSRNLFKQYIREDNPELEVIGEAENLRTARAMLKELTPDLVLFDIDLPDGTSFDLLQELQEQNRLDFDIIFITAFGTQEYLVRALEFSALKYLRKPLNKQELREAVLKALERHQNRDIFMRQINMLLENTRNNHTSSGVIALPLLKGIIEMVDLSDILYVCTAKTGNITNIYLSSSSTPLACNRTIGQFKNLLSSQQSFIQVHESTIINLKSLKRFDPVERIVTLRDGSKIYSSRRYAKTLKDYLMKEENQLEAPAPTNLRSWFQRFMGKRI